MPETWACITDAGVVGNCIVADADFIALYLPQSGFASIVSIENVSPRPGPGWTYDGTTYTAPPPPEPDPDNPPPVPEFAFEPDPTSFDNPALYVLESS